MSRRFQGKPDGWGRPGGNGCCPLNPYGKKDVRFLENADFRPFLLMLTPCVRCQ